MPGQPRSPGLNQSPERSWQPAYLSEHYDVKADAVGLDECAVLGASRVAIVLGKPREMGTSEQKSPKPSGAGTACRTDST